VWKRLERNLGDSEGYRWMEKTVALTVVIVIVAFAAAYVLLALRRLGGGK
jgi:hypothetical protein